MFMYGSLGVSATSLHREFTDSEHLSNVQSVSIWQLTRGPKMPTI